MIKNPKVSICIPAYNNPECLKNLLESISIQTYKNYEVVVTDDSTNSDVEKLCKEHDLNIIYSKNRSKLGSPNNWNASLLRAKGEYLKVMHHDDYFTEKDSLGKFVDLMKYSDIAFSSSNAVEPDGNLLRVNMLEKQYEERFKEDPALLSLGNVLGAPSACIFKRKNHIPLFDPGFIWLVDIDYYISQLTDGYNLGVTSEVLISTTNGAVGQITQAVQTNQKLILKENIRLYIKHFLIFSAKKKYKQNMIKMLLDLPMQELNINKRLLVKAKLWNLLVYKKAVKKVAP